MTSTAAPTNRRTPWHLWVVGVLSLLWNAYGCYDYLMTQTRGEAHLREAAAGMNWNAAQTESFVTYYNSMPAWMSAVWAVGVWGALLGSILLLLRMKLAVWAFIISTLAFVLSVINTYILTTPPEGVQSMIWMQGVIFAACLFFIWYSWTMAKRGVLR